MKKATKSVYKENATKAAEEILSNAPSIVEKIEATLSELFPYGPDELSKAEGAFEAQLSQDPEGTNTAIEKAEPVVQDLISAGISHIETLERWISLHVPAMEDGNNFGVSVQSTIHKFLTETRENWSKNLEAIPIYYSNRAEAVEKLGIGKTTNVETTTESQTQSRGGKDGDEDKKSKTVVREEKKDSGAVKRNRYRLKHMLKLDVQFYAKLRSSLTDLLFGYIIVMDNVEKNKEKLVTPKGTRASSYGWN